jgi:ParB-like chromosome segregation protein Spo0J
MSVTEIGDKPRKTGIVPGTGDVNSALVAHELANIYPMCDEAELKGLRESIRANGIREPIKLYEGKILDGRNRYKAAQEAGHRFVPANFVTFSGTYEQAETFVLETNSLRRHLSAAQKQELVKRLIAQHPNWPVRKLAKLAGVSKSTISNLRQTKDEDEGFRELVKAWGAASDDQQDRFVAQFAVDLHELLRG